MYPHIHVSTWPTCWPNVKLMLCSVILGHWMPLPGSIGGYVQWQASLTHQLTKWQADLRCHFQGVHLTEVHLSTSQCDQCSHTHGHQMSLYGGWVRLTFCVLGSQPASQLASCSWPANQSCDKISTCQALGWSDMWWQEDWEPNHIGPQSRVPAPPLVPLGEWPTWPKPGKWHKWALQPVIYLWY